MIEIALRRRFSKVVASPRVTTREQGKRPKLAHQSGLDMIFIFPGPRQQFIEAVDGMPVDHAREHVAQVGVGFDAVEFAGLCRPPNYAERFWKQAAVCARLRPIERTSPQFHSA